MAPEPKRRCWWPAGLALALILGAVLRLLWVMDMEYKYDECWTFLHSQDGSIWESSFWLGIHNSTGLRCPGMSLWIFIAAVKAFAITEPTGLARVVQAGNILALVLLAWFAVRAVPRNEREPWLWATALAAVNPVAVLFHRKIWPPSVLPLFSMLTLLGWWYRDRRPGAFLWGLMAVVLGQIHPSGFFLAAAFFGWAFLFDRPRVAWKGWLAGSAVGALPMLPWMWYLLTTHQDHFMTHRSWHHVFEGKFWLRWITEPFGLGLEYSLFTDFPRFLQYPVIAGQPTYLVGLLHAVVFVGLVVVLARVGYLLIMDLVRPWPVWKASWIGRSSNSAFTQNAALWGFGSLLTLTALPLHRHYMVILFPLEFLWLARLALAAAPRAAPTTETTNGREGETSTGGPDPVFRPGRVMLAGLCVAQLLISISFLGFIHEMGGSPDGDYGKVYRLQHEFRSLKPQDVLTRESAPK